MTIDVVKRPISWLVLHSKMKDYSIFVSYLITPTLPSLIESCRTFNLASCLSAFETDISRSVNTFILCISGAKPNHIRRMSITYIELVEINLKYKKNKIKIKIK